MGVMGATTSILKVLKLDENRIVTVFSIAASRIKDLIPDLENIEDISHFTALIGTRELSNQSFLQYCYGVPANRHTIKESTYYIRPKG